MLKLIKQWWQGTYIPEPPGSPFFYGFYRRHWTAEVAHVLVRFYLAHWKWLWPMIVSIAIFLLG